MEGMLIGVLETLVKVVSGFRLVGVVKMETTNEVAVSSDLQAERPSDQLLDEGEGEDVTRDPR